MRHQQLVLSINVQMCGIVGYKLFSKNTTSAGENLELAVQTIAKRGPDTFGIYSANKDIGLGHTRLSILDTSANGDQPMSDPSGRYTLIFNGEIYNHLDLKSLIKGTSLKSSSDTEVLLHLLVSHGISCLDKLNGFFALAFYDKETDTLILARDRMGIKPLLYYSDKDQFIFGSEMKALLSFPIKKTINQQALYWYLKLNYLPGNLSLLNGFAKLDPGHYLTIQGAKVEKHPFVHPKKEPITPSDYDSSQSALVRLLDQAVQKRLMSDVPLGSFLSGGTDSSVVVALASRHTTQLSTFSIGYREHSFFDETEYAELVAKKFNTDHTTFSLTNDDLLNDLDEIVSYIDEPFADSSAIPTYILSKYTSQHVKVALSGDGADELFGGYYKHLALHKALGSGLSNVVIKALHPLISGFPKSRSNSISNLIRRLDRFGQMLKLDPVERYWFLASLTNNPSDLIKSSIPDSDISGLKNNFLNSDPDLNDYLKVDQQIVLPGDMLTKVDLMSMSNSLEVRVPFLDKNVVDFARSLPSDYKIKGNERKRILQDAFKDILPNEIYQRPKKGFEVPMLHWMRNELLSELDNTLFLEDILEEQNLFVTKKVMLLRKQLLSSNPGDVHGTIWALYIFQKWYKNYFL
ncbi:MAG: asparagine synthase (glutamine-hydrolyzing) [Cyclobacteriaceae bacterium]